jgi:hypothetical protein
MEANLRTRSRIREPSDLLMSKYEVSIQRHIDRIPPFGGRWQLARCQRSRVHETGSTIHYLHVVGVDSWADPKDHIWIKLALQLGQAWVVGTPE